MKDDDSPLSQAGRAARSGSPFSHIYCSFRDTSWVACRVLGKCLAPIPWKKRIRVYVLMQALSCSFFFLLPFLLIQFQLQPYRLTLEEQRDISLTSKCLNVCQVVHCEKLKKHMTSCLLSLSVLFFLFYVTRVFLGLSSPPLFCCLMCRGGGKSSGATVCPAQWEEREEKRRVRKQLGLLILLFHQQQQQQQQQ